MPTKIFDTLDDVGRFNRKQPIPKKSAPAPVRIQRKRTKGWRKPEGAVIVDRTSRWGNPYMGTGENPDRAYLVKLYSEYMDRPEQADKRAAAIAELRGKDLVCFCPLDRPCHADVLLKLANMPIASAPG